MDCRGGAMFLAAMAVAFAYQWRIALLMLGVAPASCMVMSLMARVRNLQFDL